MKYFLQKLCVAEVSIISPIDSIFCRFISLLIIDGSEKELYLLLVILKREFSNLILKFSSNKKNQPHLDPSQLFD